MGLKNKTILLTEDDKMVSRMYERRLINEGAKVIIAYNGAEGLKKLEETKPDIILLDVMMPKMNGYEMLKSMRANSAIKNIPVIILTNLNDRPEDIKQIKELKVADYVIKSEISLVDLVKRIESHLK